MPYFLPSMLVQTKESGYSIKWSQFLQYSISSNFFSMCFFLNSIYFSPLTTSSSEFSSKCPNTAIESCPNTFGHGTTAPLDFPIPPALTSITPVNGLPQDLFSIILDPSPFLDISFLSYRPDQLCASHIYP